jgi:hypothetical protein
MALPDGRITAHSFQAFARATPRRAQNIGCDLPESGRASSAWQGPATPTTTTIATIHLMDRSPARDGMVKALRSFRDQADKADWALIDFAGHGIEINRVN